MVCFTCQKCNECLKKSAVAKHAMFSRKCLPFWLTCIDCLKDFRGDEHLQHTSCVTEDVRYGAKGVQVKEQGIKQNMWMDSVTKVINSKHDNKNVLFVFNSLKDMTNVPKIRKKFHNFMKSKLGRRYDYDQSDVAFTLLETEFAKNKAEKTQNEKNDNVDKTSNGHDKTIKKKKHQNDESQVENNQSIDQDDENTDHLTKKKRKNKKNQVEEISSENVQVEQPVENENLSKKELKKRKKQEKYLAELNEIENYQKVDISEEPAKPNKKSKRKHEETEAIPTEAKSKKRKVDKNDLPSENPNVEEYAEPDSSTLENPQTFKWDQVIIDILTHRSDNELSFKRLSKKVMAEYCERFGDDQNFEYLMKKFNKKIKSTKGIIVCKDKVMLKNDEN